MGKSQSVSPQRSTYYCRLFVGSFCLQSFIKKRRIWM